MDLQNLTEEYPRNMGGLICNQIYIGFHKDVDVFPTEPAEDAEMDELGKVTGNLTMKAGKRLYEFRSTEDAAELKFDDQGEMDGMSQNHVLDVFHPQMKAKLIGFVERTNNAKLIIIAVSREGVQYIMGSKNIPAYRIAGSGTVGKAAPDRKGYNLLFGSKGHSPCRIYSGIIPLGDDSSGS